LLRKQTNLSKKTTTTAVSKTTTSQSLSSPRFVVSALNFFLKIFTRPDQTAILLFDSAFPTSKRWWHGETLNKICRVTLQGLDQRSNMKKSQIWWSERHKCWTFK